MPCPVSKPPTFANVRRWVLGALAAGAACAHAASFDCQSATTPMERAICASPELSALDERMARSYERAMHALSPEGAALLKDSQQDWLRFVTPACMSRRSATPGGGGGDFALTLCIQTELGWRIVQLEQAGVRIGPYVFNRIDRAVSRPAAGDDDTGSHHGFVVHQVAYPQIDAPRSAATDAWNAAQRLEPAPLDPQDDTDEEADYTVHCVGERFISLGIFNSQYVHGAAHGEYRRGSRTLLLAPSVRKLAADDVFSPRSDWPGRLPSLFWSVSLQKNRAEKELPGVEPAIRARAIDPAARLLTPAGLQISFDAYEAGCHACDPGPLTVPWSTLKPLLAMPELAACKGPEAARP